MIFVFLHFMPREHFRKDQTFDKVLTDRVKIIGQVTLCFSIRGNQAVISGANRAVQCATDNLNNVTLANLLDAMRSDDQERWITKYPACWIL